VEGQPKELSLAARDDRMRQDISLVNRNISLCGQRLKVILISTSASIIQSLETYLEERRVAAPCVLGYYYFDFRDILKPGDDPVEDFLRSVIKQLCQDLPVLPKAAQDIHRRYQYKEKIPVLVLTQTILSLAGELGQTYIIIDALDECGDSSHNPNISETRRDMLKILTELSEGETVHLLVTSRDGGSVEQIDETLGEITKKPGNHNISLEGKGLDQDIERVIDWELKDPIWKSMSIANPDLLDEIKKTVKRANGMCEQSLSKTSVEDLTMIQVPFGSMSAPGVVRVDGQGSMGMSKRNKGSLENASYRD
jgi:hypothetical protein